jgi:uncharacterized iron-regulated membrane protein
MAWLAFLPAALIIASGTILHLRRVVPWIQPPVAKGVPGQPKLEINAVFDLILKNSALRDERQLSSWSDIKSIEYKPNNGVWSLRSKSNFEVQVDANSGAIVSAAPRRSIWLIQLHEGSLFGDVFLWLVFFPTGLLLVVLEVSGAYLLWDSWKRKRSKHGSG